jgi:hypothetical protein
MAKHFMIYYAKSTGSYIVTEPKPWARNNKNYFKQYDFIKKTPTTHEIEKYLIDNKGFKKVNTNDKKISLIQNLDSNINI